MRQVRLSAVLMAGVWCVFGLTGILTAQPFPAGPADDPTLSIGSYRIAVAPAYQGIMAASGYPGYIVATMRLQSPNLIDAFTLVGRSNPHPHGSPPDIGGTPVGTAGTIISDSSFSVVPPGFQGPPGTAEVHTEIRSLNMTPFGSGVAGCPSPLNFAVRAGTAAPLQPISPGEVESLNTPAGGFPAESFFDVFVEVDLPAFGLVPNLTLYNTTALVVTSTGLTSFPPPVVYVHVNSSAVPVYVRGSNALFGWLVLAGHLAHAQDCPSGAAQLQSALANVPEMPVPLATANTPFVGQMVVNGVGATATGPIGVDIGLSPVASPLNFQITGMASSLIILASAALADPGAIVLGPNNSVDLHLASLNILVNGAIPPAFPWFTLNPLGNYGLTIPNILLNAPNASLALQAGLLSPAYPLGVQLTAASVLRTPTLLPAAPGCIAGATNLVQSDDTSIQVDITPSNLTPWFNFYGVAYSNLFVGSNGYITSASFTTFSETVSVFVGTSGGAKICTWFDDFNFAATTSPGATNTVFVSDNPGNEFMEVCWNNVRQLGSGTNPNDSNTFKATITPGRITFDYISVKALDGLVGLTPGTGTATSSLALNLSFGNAIAPFNATTPFVSPNELFNGTTNLNDLSGTSLHFVLSTVGTAAGVPTAIF